MDNRIKALLLSAAACVTAGAQQPGDPVVTAVSLVTDSVAVSATQGTSLPGVVPELQSGMTLSLEDCLAIALSENPTVRVADMDIKRVDYSRWETISQLLPQITFSGTYNRMLAKQVTYMNMNFEDLLGGLGGGSGSGDESTESGSGSEALSRAATSKSSDNGIKVGLDNSYQLGFSASLPVIAPQLWASLKLSDTQILQSIEQARASKLDLIDQVKSAYYTLLLAQSSKKVIQQSYDMAAFTHDLYVKQQKLGTASEFDVLRTEVAMRNVEPDLMQADLAIKQAHLQLLLLLGLEPTFDFNVSGSLEDYERTMYADVLSINPDYSANTQLVQLGLQSTMLDQALSVEKASLYPTLAATAMYAWTSSTNGSPFSFRWNPYSVVGLQLSIPIFTGGKRYARIKEAEIQIEEMKWNRDYLDRSVGTQVDLALDNIRVNVRKIASCSETVGQAQRAHDIMRQSFAIGAASYLNLRDSELALTQTQLAYYQAIYNYLVARSQLDLLLGNGQPVEVPVEYRKYDHRD